MIRISVTHEENVLCFKVEGRLAGYGVDELRGAILRREHQGEFEVDITEVTFVDDEGEKLLVWIDRIGGRFHKVGVFSHFLLHRLNITVPMQKRTGTHKLELRPHSGAALHKVPHRDAAPGT